jgi:hypothetical protein
MHGPILDSRAATDNRPFLNHRDLQRVFPDKIVMNHGIFIGFLGKIGDAEVMLFSKEKILRTG